MIKSKHEQHSYYKCSITKHSIMSFVYSKVNYYKITWLSFPLIFCWVRPVRSQKHADRKQLTCDIWLRTNCITDFKILIYEREKNVLCTLQIFDHIAVKKN